MWKKLNLKLFHSLHKLEDPKKQESSTRQLPETNSDSIASLAALSAVSTLGVGFAAIRRKRQSA